MSDEQLNKMFALEGRVEQLVIELEQANQHIRHLKQRIDDLLVERELLQRRALSPW